MGSGKIIKCRDAWAGKEKLASGFKLRILLEHGGVASDRLRTRRVARKLCHSTSL